MEDVNTRAPTARDVFANRDFRTYWLGTVVSQAGSFMQGISIPFILHDVTGSNAWVGASALASVAPALVMAPIAGILSDRVDRRRLLLTANAIQLASSIALWLLSLAGELSPWPIVALLACGGVGGGIQFTTQLALVPLLVPPRLLPTASRINSVTFPAARAVGPAIAGVILGAKGPTWTIAINSLSFLVVMGALAVVRPAPGPTSARRASLGSDFRIGLSYARRRGLLLAMASAFVTSLLGGPLLSLTAGLVAEDLNGGPRLIGTLVALQGAGSVLGSAWLVTRGNLHRCSAVVRVGYLVYGVAVAGAVATVEPAVAGVCYALAGAGHVLVSSTLVTSLQLQVDEEYRGRIMGLHLTAIQLGVPIGALVGGVVGDRVGLRPTLGVYGVALIGYVVLAHHRFDGLRQLDRAQLVTVANTP